MEGLYILPLKGAVQGSIRAVSNLDASVLLPQHVDFVLLQEARGQLAKSLRKILSTLIFSASSFIGPSEEKTDMLEWEMRFRKFSLFQS